MHHLNLKDPMVKSNAKCLFAWGLSSIEPRIYQYSEQPEQK